MPLVLLKKKVIIRLISWDFHVLRKKTNTISSRYKRYIERFLSVNDYQSIFECIQIIPNKFKCNILKLKTKDGLTPLHQAVDNENTDTIELLLKDLSQDEKFDLLKITTKNGWSPLYQAIRNKSNDDNIDKIELLMRDLSRSNIQATQNEIL